MKLRQIAKGQISEGMLDRLQRLFGGRQEPPKPKKRRKRKT